MQAARSSEMLASFHIRTRRHNSVVRGLNFHSRENVKSRKNEE